MENVSGIEKYDQIADVIGNTSPSLFHLPCVWFTCESMWVWDSGIPHLFVLSKMPILSAARKVEM